MAGYTKNIAVIRGIKSGFSADGGALSGLVKVEKYGLFFRAEISFINFAPLTQGRYVTAVTDGEKAVVCEGAYSESQSEIDTSCGFAAAICFVNGEVSPVAVAVCGDMAWAVPLAVRKIESEEKNKDLPEAGAAYEDEAIAEDNYYEYGKNTQGTGDVRQNNGQKEGGVGRENEADFSLRQKSEKAESARRAVSGGDADIAEGANAAANAEKNSEPRRKDGQQNQIKADVHSYGEAAFSEDKKGDCPADMPRLTEEKAGNFENYSENKNKENLTFFKEEKSGGESSAEKGYAAENYKSDGGGACKDENNFISADKNTTKAAACGKGKDSKSDFCNAEKNDGKAREIPLADDLGFYSRMRGEIEKLLSSHPHEKALEEAVEGSRWVRITYGGKRFYVFGVISEDGRPAYVCYGVPAMGTACPESLKGMAGFIPAGDGGYWVMYQDAGTGASVKLTST